MLNANDAIGVARPTAAYGNFGRDDVSLPCEATVKAETLKKYLRRSGKCL